MNPTEESLYTNSKMTTTKVAKSKKAKKNRKIVLEYNDMDSDRVVPVPDSHEMGNYSSSIPVTKKKLFRGTSYKSKENTGKRVEVEEVDLIDS